MKTSILKSVLLLAIFTGMMSITEVYAQTLQEITIGALDEIDWTYTTIDEKLLKSNYSGDNGRYEQYFLTNENGQVLTLMVTSSMRISKNKRTEVVKFLNRCNWGLTLGCFELDVKDGEVRFRRSVDVEGGKLAPKMVQTMLALSLRQYDKAYPYIMKICYGDMNADEAYEEYTEEE